MQLHFCIPFVDATGFLEANIGIAVSRLRNIFQLYSLFWCERSYTYFLFHFSLRVEVLTETFYIHDPNLQERFHHTLRSQTLHTIQNCQRYVHHGYCRASERRRFMLALQVAWILIEKKPFRFRQISGLSVSQLFYARMRAIYHGYDAWESRYFV